MLLAQRYAPIIADDVTLCYASFGPNFRTACSSCKIIEFMQIEFFSPNAQELESEPDVHDPGLLRIQLHS